LESFAIGYPSSEPVPDEILTLREVASLLKVAAKTVYAMAQAAEMPAFKVRGQWRFRRADLDAWIQQQTAARRSHKAGD
jgi:excisionase family DNA binding protein